MIFDNKPISAITDEELINLIDNQEENLWIDFKQMQYHRDQIKIDQTKSEKRKHEICKDVTAIANAEGGYILIGVYEKDKVAQRFINVSDVEREAESIYDICHQHIVPRIAKLEVKTRKLRWQGEIFNLIIIHIPFSENRPHGFHSKGTLNFVKRYADTTKEFQMEEFIPELIARYHLPSMDDIRVQLDRIESQTTTILKDIGGSE